MPVNSDAVMKAAIRSSKQVAVKEEVPVVPLGSDDALKQAIRSSKQGGRDETLASSLGPVKKKETGTPPSSTGGIAGGGTSQSLSASGLPPQTAQVQPDQTGGAIEESAVEQVDTPVQQAPPAPTPYSGGSLLVDRSGMDFAPVLGFAGAAVKGGRVMPTAKAEKEVLDDNKRNKQRYDAIANSTADTIIGDYLNEKKNISQFDYWSANRLEQQRLGKVAKYITDFQNGDAKFDDFKYLLKSAPVAAKQVIEQLAPGVVLDSDQKIADFLDKSNSFIKQATIQSRIQNGQIQAENINQEVGKIKNYIPEFDPSKILDEDYSGMMVDSKKKRLKELDDAYPLTRDQFIGSGMEGYGPTKYRRNEEEYTRKVSEAEKEYAQRQDLLGLAAANAYAKQNPKASPLEIGLVYLKNADPERYNLRKAAGYRDPDDGKWSKIGISALYAAGDKDVVPTLDEKERQINDMYPDDLIADTYHRIGAEHAKKLGAMKYLVSGSPSQKDADEYIANMPQENRDAYYKHIREGGLYKVPLQGAVPQLGLGVAGVVGSLGNAGADLLSYFTGGRVGRTEKERAYESLGDPYETRYAHVGEYAPAVQRLNQLREKMKTGQLTGEELNEKRDLETYTDVRTGVGKFIDGGFNVAGQVLAQAALTELTGGAIIGAAGKVGLVAAEGAVSGGSVLRTVASAGIKREAIKKSAAAMISFASSYDDASKQALVLMPGDENGIKRQLFSTIVAGANSASENMFKDHKAFDAFKGHMAPVYANIVNQLTTGKITQQALASELKKALKAGLVWAGNTVKEDFKEAAEELSVSLATSTATAVLAPTKFNKKQAYDDAKSTVATTLVDGSIVAGFAGASTSKANKLTLPVIANIGRDKVFTQNVRNEISRQLQAGDITQQQANEKNKIINIAEQINQKGIPRVLEYKNLSPHQQVKYFGQTLNESLLKSRLSEYRQAQVEIKKRRDAGEDVPDTEDDVPTEQIEKQIQESEKIRKDIINNNVYVTDEFGLVDIKRANEIEATQPVSQPRQRTAEDVKLDRQRELQDIQNRLDNGEFVGSQEDVMEDVKDVRAQVNLKYDTELNNLNPIQNEEIQQPVQQVPDAAAAEGLTEQAAGDTTPAAGVPEEASGAGAITPAAEAGTAVVAPTREQIAEDVSAGRTVSLTYQTLKAVPDYLKDKVALVTDANGDPAFGATVSQSEADYLAQQGSVGIATEASPSSEDAATPTSPVAESQAFVAQPDTTVQPTQSGTAPVSDIAAGVQSLTPEEKAQYIKNIVRGDKAAAKKILDSKKKTPNEQQQRTTEQSAATVEPAAASVVAPSTVVQPEQPVVTGTQEVKQEAPQQPAALEQTKEKPFEERTDAEHATYIRDKFIKTFTAKGVPEDQVRAAAALMDARANAAFPDNPDAWYRQIQDIGEGGFKQENSLFQIADDIDLFKESNVAEAKRFIDKVFALTENVNEAKIVYRRLASKYHPDKNPSATATDIMKYLNEVKESYDKGIRPKSQNHQSKESGAYTDRQKKEDEEFWKKNEQFWREYKKREQERRGGEQASNKEKENDERKRYEQNRADERRRYEEKKEEERIRYEERIKAEKRGYEEAIAKDKASRDAFLAREKANREAYDKKVAAEKKAYEDRVAKDKEKANDFAAREKAAREAYAEKQRKEREDYLARVAADMKKSSRLYQNITQGKPKGALETLANGRKIIHALDAPDFSTAVHELAHVFEDELAKDERDVIEKWAGTQTWSEQTSEAFARGFERYLRDGNAPTSYLKTIFEKAKKWLETIYTSLKGSPIEKNITPEVKQVFDNLFKTEKQKQNERSEQQQRATERPTAKSVVQQVPPSTPAAESATVTTEAPASSGKARAASADIRQGLSEDQPVVSSTETIRPKSNKEVSLGDTVLWNGEQYVVDGINRKDGTFNLWKKGTLSFVKSAEVSDKEFGGITSKSARAQGLNDGGISDVVGRDNVDDIDATIDNEESDSKKEVLRTVKQVSEAITRINPNAVVVVHSSDESFRRHYAEAGGSGTARGFFNNGNELHINMEHADTTTAFHEGAHAVFAYVFGNDPKTRDRFYEQLKSALKGTPHESNISRFVDMNYGDASPGTKADEYITEFFARVADGKIVLENLNRSMLDKIKSAIRKVAEFIGLDPKFIGLDKNRDVVEFARKLRDAFVDGKAISTTNAAATTSGVRAQNIDEEDLSFDDRRRELKGLLDNGIITQDEYNEYIAEVNRLEEAAQPKVSGVTHGTIEEKRKALNINGKTGKNKFSDAEVRAAADAAIKNGFDVRELIHDVIDNNDTLSAVETEIVGRYIAGLEAEFRTLNDRVEDAAVDGKDLARLKQNRDVAAHEIGEAYYATELSGSNQGRALRYRQIHRLEDGSLAAAFIRESDTSKVTKLSQEQIDRVIREHKELTEAKAKWEKKLAEIAAREEANKAKIIVENQKKSTPKNTKKTKDQFDKERKTIADDIKQKVLKLRNGDNPAKDQKSKSQMIDVLAEHDPESQPAVNKEKSLAAVSSDVSKLVRSFVEQGVTNFDAVVDGIHDLMKDSIADLSRQDVINTIAGEYREKKPTKNEISESIYEIKRQSELIVKLEKLLAGETPATEKERIKRSAEIEKLEAQIKGLTTQRRKEQVVQRNIRKLEIELMRVTERREKAPANSKENRDLTDREKELTEKIKAEKEKWAKENKPSDMLDNLKKKYQALNDKLQKKLDDKDYSTDPVPERVKLDDEAKKLRDAYLDKKREIAKRLLQQELDNRSKSRKWFDRAVSFTGIPRLLMATMDFSAVLRQGLVLTASHPIIAFGYRNAQVQQADGTIQTEKQWGAFWQMFKHAFSEKQYSDWMNDLKSSDAYEHMQAAGLYIADPDEMELHKREETFMSDLIQKIPYIGRPGKIGKFKVGGLITGSERAYASYLNQMRVEIFKNGAALLENSGITMQTSSESHEAWAKFVNNATGRGSYTKDLERSPGALNFLSATFFSPRLIAARLNLLGITDLATIFGSSGFYRSMPAATRKMVAGDMLRFAAINAMRTLIVAGLTWDDDDVEIGVDPRSTDFGKIKVGNTRWDTWGGFAQYIRIMWQMIRGQTKDATTGQVREIGETFPFTTKGEMLGSFLRGKLAPVPALGVDIFLFGGKDIVGQEIEPVEAFWGHVIPMVAQDVYDAYQEDPTLQRFVLSLIPSITGDAVTVYEPRASKTSSKSGGMKAEKAAGALKAAKAAQ